jgi:hypothetical protein
MAAHSKRKFLIVFIEGVSSVVSRELSLNEILKEDNNAWEYIYAIQDNIDNILDLKLGERLEMQFNRDNKDSFGIIKRIN